MTRLYRTAVRGTAMLAVALVTTLVWGAPAYAASYSWNVASGDWSTPTNWSPPTGPPGPLDDAVISNNGTATLSANATVNAFTLSAGTLGGTANLDVNGFLSWSAGTITGSGTVTVNGGMSITGSCGNHTLNGRTLVLAGGTGTLSGTNNCVAMINSVFTNNSTFEFAADGGGSSQGFQLGSFGATVTVNNNGILRKQTGNTGNSIAGGVFNNTGTVEVLSGTLTAGFHNGGTSSAAATYSIASGSTLTVGAAHTFVAGSSIGGTGTLRVDTPATVAFAGSVNMGGGATRFSSGTANFTGTVNAGAVTIELGAANFNSAATAASTTLDSGGTLGGTGNVDIAGVLTWIYGTITGSGTVTVNGGMSITGFCGNLTLNGRTLVLAGGTGTLSTNTCVQMTNAVFTNNSIFEFTADGGGGSQGFQGFGATSVNNNGILRKQTGNTGTSTIPTFTNTGTVESLSGNLNFVGSYTQTAGVTRLNGGGLTSSQTMNIQGGTLEGIGTLTATVNNSGGTLSPGLSAGQLNETGAYTQGASGAFTTEIGGLTVGTQYDRAAISGAATLAGTLNISLINAYEPNVGDTFTIMTFGSRTGDFTTVNGTSLPNGKLFQKNLSATNVVLEVVNAPTPTPTSTAPTATPTPTLTPSPTVTATPVLCGNGLTDGGEQCDDGNLAAGDCCSPTCQFEATGSTCSDGNACTGTDQCAAGVCSGTTNADGTSCNDQNVCTSDDQCTGGLCAGVARPNGTLCGDGNGCTGGDQCLGGTCLGVPQPNGTLCDDQNACTTGDQCSGGSCTGAPSGNGAPCDDHNDCTAADQCSGGSCNGTPKPNGAVCNDENACTQADQCAGGACNGTPTPEGAACNDHNDCTSPDQCAGGVCGGLPRPDGALCDDGNDCTSPDQCGGGGCAGAARPNGALCDDQNDCTSPDSCSAGGCAGPPRVNGVLCDDENDCTSPDHCAGGACDGPARANGAVCDDENTCTSADQCDGGVCNGAPDSDGSACNDGIYCTTDDECGGGTCVGVARPDGALCSDGTPCTSEDQCSGGACAGTPLADGTSCTDGNGCTTVDQCSGGSCSGNPVLNGTVCFDGNACSSGDQCSGGDCTGTPVVDGALCDDANGCTSADQCAGGDCSGAAIADGAVCSDGNACTSNDVCADGVCAGDQTCADRYLCYKTKATTAFTPLNVTLVDAFETTTAEVKKPAALCPPADENEEGAIDPVTHEESYSIKPTLKHQKQTNLEVTDQFGTLHVDTVKADRLMVPTNKGLGSPPPPVTGTIDHYKCYKIKITSGTAKFPKGVQATVQDQFEHRLYDVKKPQRLCVPVDKNGEGITSPAAHLMCYQVKATKGAPKHVKVVGQIHTLNQFGGGRLDTLKEDELCVPAEKNP